MNLGVREWTRRWKAGVSDQQLSMCRPSHVVILDQQKGWICWFGIGTSKEYSDLFNRLYCIHI